MAPSAPQPAASPGRARLLAPALLLAALALCYLPALTATYGYADDFPQLLESQQRAKWLVDAWNQDARPVGGWLTEWSFHAAGTIAGLAYLRAASLLLVLLLALAIYRHLLPHLREPALAVLAALLISTGTPFQVNIGWASMWPYMIPPVLSYAAYLAIARGGQGSLPYRAKCWLPALLLLYISLNIYPPSTMFLWFWFGVDAVMADIPLSRLLRRFALLLVLCGASSGLYYGIYKLLGYQHSRGQITPEIFKKLLWFVRAVVTTASRLQWFDCTSRWLPLVVWLLIVTGLFLLRRNSILALAVKLGLMIASLFLCYLPLLIVKEFYAPFRSQLVVGSYIGALAFLALVHILVRLRATAGMRYLAICALVGAGLVKANATLMNHIVLPQSFDYVFLRGALTGELAAHKQVVIMESTLSPKCWDELCRVTSEMPDEYHMLSAMAGLIARESWHGPGPRPEYNFRTVPHGTPGAPDEHTAIIDTWPVMEMLNSK